MNQPSGSNEKRIYKVELGHSSVLVQSSSADEAIRAARTRFSLDMPRLWDVIQQLTDDKFQVSLVY